ncbi:hypothetical protein [Polynucleobacter sp. CS-Odin-A6]|uniref:hypothetical protein n=1 Tax=Polynucleobacter sp. CS-Odin-A6 TaxID=2689106 RepID=UPI001C0D4625|nr:hypothetical protein [Polynucleobacter sp. CS-Odin-A6]MBU3621116.1 sugar transferase [Polynucleobacter sp. CS-Odin-A6]
MSGIQNIPIALFVYNRPEHTKAVIESLLKNDIAKDTSIYIFSDGPKNFEQEGLVKRTREYIDTITGFKEIFIEQSQSNLGLAKSLIIGVTKILKIYEKVIVLEDDIKVSKEFLVYMNNALNFYQKDIRIGSITGYTVPINFPKNYKGDIYLNTRHSSWGWGTYSRVWSNVDWSHEDFHKFIKNKESVESFSQSGSDLVTMLKKQNNGKLDSWSIIFDYHCWKYNLYSIAPRYNLIENFGFDKTGTHCNTAPSHYANKLTDYKIVHFIEGILENKEITNQNYAIYSQSLIKRFYKRFFREYLSWMKNLYSKH